MAIRFNERGMEIVKARRGSFDKKDNFSIIFMGDTHIGMTKEGSPQKGQTCYTSVTGKNSAYGKYSLLLQKLMGKVKSDKAFKDLYCIIHGGDGTHHGEKYLKMFINLTESRLHYKSTTINDKDKIPLLMNSGNHEYKKAQSKKGGVTNKYYLDNVGAENEIIELHGPNFGPMVAVILLNTGYTNSGKLEKNKDFGSELKKVEKRMEEIHKKAPGMRFIVDMHIPPRVSGLSTGPLWPHTLNHVYSSKFLAFLRRKYKWIIGVVAHHKHANYKYTSIPYTFHKNKVSHSIPIFLTAQGGNCDYEKSPNEQSRYHFYKVNLSKKQGQQFKIASVYEYDLINKAGKYSLVLGPKIKLVK